MAYLCSCQALRCVGQCRRYGLKLALRKCFLHGSSSSAQIAFASNDPASARKPLRSEGSQSDVKAWAGVQVDASVVWDGLRNCLERFRLPAGNSAG